MEKRFDGRFLSRRVHATGKQSIFDLLIAEVIFVKHWQKSIEPAGDSIVFAKRLQTTATRFHQERFVIEIRRRIAFAEDC